MHAYFAVVNVIIHCSIIIHINMERELDSHVHVYLRVRRVVMENDVIVNKLVDVGDLSPRFQSREMVSGSAGSGNRNGGITHCPSHYHGLINYHIFKQSLFSKFWYVHYTVEPL